MAGQIPAILLRREHPLDAPKRQPRIVPPPGLQHVALRRVRNVAPESAYPLQYARMRETHALLAVDLMPADVHHQQPQPIPPVPVVLLQPGIAALEIRRAREPRLPARPA